MNIEYLKWKVGYADGFEIDEYSMIDLPDKKRYIITSDTFSKFILSWDSIYSPVLLHRAVIGVNKHCEKWSIILYPFIVVVTDFEDINIKFGDSDIGQSQEKNIEQALEYIWKQETK